MVKQYESLVQLHLSICLQYRTASFGHRSICIIASVTQKKICFDQLSTPKMRCSVWRVAYPHEQVRISYLRGVLLLVAPRFRRTYHIALAFFLSCLGRLDFLDGKQRVWVNFIGKPNLGQTSRPTKDGASSLEFQLSVKLARIQLFSKTLHMFPFTIRSEEYVRVLICFHDDLRLKYIPDVYQQRFFLEMK
jgi:hypothetical protein